MKLAPLLADFLYDQKRLTLAGIGTFLLDPSLQTNTEIHHSSEGISFEYNAGAGDDDSLINYISSKTGKMKTLASSDLSSYVELARQFLNIGKPFQIEGIGTLVKMTSGRLDFTSDHVLADKLKETGNKELSATSISDQSLTTYESLKPHIDKSPGSKKIFVAFLVIATAAVVIWGGYTMYRSNSPKTSGEQLQSAEETLPVSDTTKYISSSQIDTTAINHSPAVSSASGTYRFVIEIANRKRAYYRYEMLKKGNVPVQLSTTDSVRYKLFFVLPATPADTSRIVDSLSIWYPSPNKGKAFVE